MMARAHGLRRYWRGFTLIEMLVALTIFSFIGVASYQLLSSTGRLQQSGEARFRAMSGLQAAVRLFDEDFAQFSPRAIPREGGEPEPALDAAPRDAQVEFTRAGWRNPLGLPRSGLQRVAWLLDDDGRLIRRYRKDIDNRDPHEVVERVLLDGVDKFALRYLDDKGNWQEQWPPEAQAENTDGKKPPESVPLAVEVRIVHRQIGEVSRVVPLR